MYLEISFPCLIDTWKTDTFYTTWSTYLDKQERSWWFWLSVDENFIFFCFYFLQIVVFTLKEPPLVSKMQTVQNEPITDIKIVCQKDKYPPGFYIVSTKYFSSNVMQGYIKAIKQQNLDANCLVQEHNFIEILANLIVFFFIV